jgi:hypothetical protein
MGEQYQYKAMDDIKKARKMAAEGAKQLCKNCCEDEDEEKSGCGHWLASYGRAGHRQWLVP